MNTIAYSIPTDVSRQEAMAAAIANFCIDFPITINGDFIEVHGEPSRESVREFRLTLKRGRHSVLPQYLRINTSVWYEIWQDDLLIAQAESFDWLDKRLREYNYPAEVLKEHVTVRTVERELPTVPKHWYTPVK